MGHMEQALEGLLKPIVRSASMRNKQFQQFRNGSVPTYPMLWAKHTGGGYVRLPPVGLSGMLILVYVSERLYRHANTCEVSKESVGTGLLNRVSDVFVSCLFVCLFGLGQYDFSDPIAV